MKKQLSLIMLGLLLISTMGFLTNTAHSYTPADYKTSIIKAADRLVALQSGLPGPPADYAWNWLVTGLTAHDGNPSDANQFGINALSLIDAYLITGNSAYLTAAEKTASFMMWGDPTLGDFYNGHGPYGWGYSSDYLFLMELSAITGDMSYKNYALAAWTWTRTSPLHPVYNDGHQADFFEHFVGGWIDNYGIAGWGASDYGLVALQMGDTAWADGLAVVINNNLADIIAGTTRGGASQYKDLGMAWTLKFLLTDNPVTYASSIATLKTDLKADQLPDGSWSDGNPEGNAQTTAYVVIGLWTAGECTAASKGADWLVAHQLANGGWSASPDEYSETDSEAMQAVFTATSYASSLYISPSPVNKLPGDVGSTFDVYVKLENFGNLMGFDIKLTWDSSLITETAVDYTTYLNALWGVGTWSKVFEDSGAGYYELAASSISVPASNEGASILFKKTFRIDKSCNFPLSTNIHFAVVKLSDNTTPIPNPIVPTTVTDGIYTISGTTPDLEFKVLKQNKKTGVYEPVTLPDHFEYCNYFEVEVYVTDICVNSPLQDYDVKISFDPTLARFVDVDGWGIFGTGTVDTSVATVVHVSGVGSWYGDEGLLFKLTFHVEFAVAPEHIWKNGNLNYMTFPISIADASLSFGSHGTIPKSGITIPSPLTFEVDFIRGDVDCNGVVNMADISAVAYYYGQSASVKPEYDLTNNGGVIDIYDIVTIATNYGYGMDP